MGDQAVVRIVYGDDWQGLYINGELAFEGHRIDPVHALECLGFNVPCIEADPVWLEEEMRLPKQLSDVKRVSVHRASEET